MFLLLLLLSCLDPFDTRGHSRARVDFMQAIPKVKSGKKVLETERLSKEGTEYYGAEVEDEALDHIIKFYAACVSAFDSFDLSFKSGELLFEYYKGEAPLKESIDKDEKNPVVRNVAYFMQDRVKMVYNPEKGIMESVNIPFHGFSRALCSSVYPGLDNEEQEEILGVLEGFSARSKYFIKREDDKVKLEIWLEIKHKLKGKSLLRIFECYL